MSDDDGKSEGVRIPSALLVPLLSALLGLGGGVGGHYMSHEPQAVSGEAHVVVVKRLDKLEAAVVELRIDAGKVDTRLDGFATTLGEIKASIARVETSVDGLTARRR